MNYARSLGLLVVAALALMAFAASASATSITSSEGETPTIVATNSEPLTLHGFVDITCGHSIVKGKVEDHGLGKPASGKLSDLGFTNCNHHVFVLKPGSLSVVPTTPTGNGTVSSSGAEVTVVVTTIFGSTHCIFGTNNTKIGTLTGSAGGHASLAISANINTLSTDTACGFAPAAWTGKYKVTSPTGLQVH